MKRVFSALVLIPLVVALVLLAPPIVFVLFVALLVSLSLWEFYALGHKLGADCHVALGLGVGICCVLSQWYGWPSTLEILVLGSVVCGMISLFRESDVEHVARGWIVTVFGWVYIALPLALLYDLRYGDLPQTGTALVFYLLVLQWVQDTAAYYIGKTWGKHRLAPRFSPKKSLEGAVAGLVGAAAVGWSFHYWVFEETRWSQVLILSLGLAVAGQLSDLAESLLKRQANVKDSSSLIPGHGGILDRIDGLLFATPILWITVRHWSV